MGRLPRVLHGGYIGGNEGGAGGALLGGKLIEIDGVVIFQPEGA